MIATRQWRIIVTGIPRTKKNSATIGRVGNRPGARALLIPSKQWTKWVRTAEISVERSPLGGVVAKRDYRPWIWKKARKVKGLPPNLQAANPPCWIPPRVGLNCRATFYRDANRGDALGFYQGLADLLQERGILENDVQLVRWDGCRLEKDPDRPRVEVILEEISVLDPMLPDEEPGDSEGPFK